MGNTSDIHTIKFTAEEMLLIWLVINIDETGKDQRKYIDPERTRIAINIDWKIKEFTYNDKENEKTQWVEWEIEFITEEKSLLLEFMKNMEMNLEQSKVRKSLQDKLS